MTLPNQLIAQITGAPCLIASDQESRVNACLEAVAAHPHAAELLAEHAASGDDEGFWSDDQSSWMAQLRPYVIKDGVLQIPVKGMLLHNFPFALGNYATGYLYIQKAFERGCRDFKDGNIKGVALISDSPGGLVAGCWDAVDKMVAAKQDAKVPVRGFAHEMAASAAYGLVGGVADDIVISRTGLVGSIGVVVMHVDRSGALDQAGLKVSYIYQSDGKVDGNPYEPLSDRAKARMQARIDTLYQIFVSSVARGRGLSEDEVRNLKSFTYSADEAVSNGLADSIGSLDDAVAAFAADLSETSGDEDMTTQTNTAVDQAALDAARSEGRAEAEQASANAANEARQAERARVAGIMGLEEAQGREALANHFAMNTDFSVDAAKDALAAAPKAEVKTDGPTPFEEAMDKGNPGVTATTEATDETQSDPIALARGIGLACVRPAPKN